jgi:hypothetical protein
MADDEDDGKPLDLAKLSQRIAKIQENGLATPAQKLFDLATEKPPQALMQDFFRSSSPEVVNATRDAVTSLLGALPPFEFDSQLSTTGDRLASLMLQLQMTGYMLRNAEYVVTLRKLLQLKGRTVEEYRVAFDRIDLDKSGFIETGEVKELLREVYNDDPPPFEVAAFVQLFDTECAQGPPSALRPPPSALRPPPSALVPPPSLPSSPPAFPLPQQLHALF